MSDIEIAFVDNQFCLQIENGDLKDDQGLETSVSISLFSDQRVTEDELGDLETDKKGWWADSISEIENDKIGSKLWLLSRSKQSDSVLSDFEIYSAKALEWMTEDGLTKNISTSADYNDNGDLILDIEITKPDNKVIKISRVWDGQEAKR